MIVLGVDAASGFAIAAYDTSKPVSAIETDSIHLEGSIADKLTQIRQYLPPIIKRYGPVFAAVEAPMNFMPGHAAGKKVAVMKARAQAGLLAGVDPNAIADSGGGGMTPDIISDLGQIAGAAYMALLCWNVRAIQVRAQSWQTLIPKNIKAQFSGDGATKKRAKAFCDSLRIVAGNEHKRDAALISIWCAGEAKRFLQFGAAA